MKIVCNKKILVNKIGVAQKAVSSKTTLNALKNLLLDVVDGKLIITGYDLETVIIATMDVEMERPGKVSIDSKLFGDIARKLPDENIELELIEETNKLKVVSGPSQFELALGDVSEYPEIPTVNEDSKFSINSKVLKDMVAETKFATSQDQTKPILMGELIEIEKDSISLVAIDGYRLAFSKQTVETGIENPGKIIVPGKGLSDISSIIGSDNFDIEIGFGAKFMSASFQDIKFMTRLLEGAFIEYKRLIPNEYQTEVKVNRRKFLEAIDRATLVSEKDNNSLVKLSVTDEFIQATTSSDIGASAEQVNIEKSGDSLNVAFNARYLTEALKVMSSEDITIRFTSNVSPCTIHPMDDSDYLYLLLPVRLAK